MKTKLYFSVMIAATILISIFTFGCKKPAVSTGTYSGTTQVPDAIKPIEGPAASFDQALELALVHDRDVLMIFSARWCKPCKVMNNEVWSSPSLNTTLENYVIYRVDVDRERRLANKFGVRTVPTYIIVDKSAKPQRIGTGQRTLYEIQRWLE